MASTVLLSLVQQSIGIDGLELIFVDDASDDAGRDMGAAGGI